MKTKMSLFDSNRWFVEFPLYQYVEDVKALAKANSLIIVDAKFIKDSIGNLKASSVPVLTLKTDERLQVKTNTIKKLKTKKSSKKIKKD
jgi:hypothetical protein